MDTTVLSIAISLFGASVAGLTFWVVHLRRGKIEGKQPSRIILRTMDNRDRGFSVSVHLIIHCEGRSGYVISNLTAAIQKNQTQQWLHDWSIGDNEKRDGCGLRVTPEGISTCHTFASKSGDNWRFTSGTYTISITCYENGVTPIPIRPSDKITLSDQLASKLEAGDAEIIFVWDGNKSEYVLDSNLT